MKNKKQYYKTFLGIKYFEIPKDSEDLFKILVKT